MVNWTKPLVINNNKIWKSNDNIFGKWSRMLGKKNKIFGNGLIIFSLRVESMAYVSKDFLAWEWNQWHMFLRANIKSMHCKYTSLEWACSKYSFPVRTKEKTSNKLFPQHTFFKLQNDNKIKFVVINRILILGH